MSRYVSNRRAKVWVWVVWSVIRFRFWVKVIVKNSIIVKVYRR